MTRHPQDSTRGTDPPAISPPSARLTAIADGTSDPHVAALADEVRGQDDRLAYAEAALHHLADALGIDLPGLPDHLRIRRHDPVPDEPDSEGAVQ